MALVRIGRALVIVAALVLSYRPVSAQQVPVSAPQPTLQGFSIVLVLGDLHDGSTSDNIPAAARAALGDLKDFLPYRSYRMLDTAWVLGSATRFQANTHVRGADDQLYDVSLDSTPVVSPSLRVAFQLREAGSDPRRRAEAAENEAQMKAKILQISNERAGVEKDSQTSDASESAEQRGQRLARNRDRIQMLDRLVATLQKEIQQQQRSTGAEALIDTSFNMRLGETVVVGTSRVRGDKALIALLTAVRK